MTHASHPLQTTPSFPTTNILLFPCSHNNDILAVTLAASHSLQCPMHALRREGEGLVDNDLQSAVRHQGGQLILHIGVVGEAVEGSIGEGGMGGGHVAGVRRRYRDKCSIRLDHPRAPREPVRLPHRVYDRIHTSDPVDLLPLLGGVVDDEVGAELLYVLHIAGTAGSGDPGALELRQLDSQTSNGAGASQDEHLGCCSDLGAVEENLVGGSADECEGSGLLEGQALGDLAQFGEGDVDVLREAAASDAVTAVVAALAPVHCEHFVPHGE
mmetsp:Transcript_3060/g.7098  ORF Transcript_3060/g.7098 Transcript_3060/m.7098 type:complete len:270 (-) Transcript_3060:306-1115(-)